MQKRYIHFYDLPSIIRGSFPNLPQWPILHELVDPNSNKTKKCKGQKMEGKTVAEPKLTKEEHFQWMPEHQQAFDALKEPLVTAPVWVI